MDKAGGTQTPQPVVLTLADHEQDPHDVQFWIDEVQRRSGGSLRIQVTNRWRDQEFAYDKATIADVQAGKVQLAKVNARAYDTVGVDSFQALVAPFLIDNHPLQRRVLESDLMGEMLAGTGKLGLVGLAVLPTRLRKPLGVSGPLVTAEDYRGARVGTREGEVAKATFAALGATPVETIPGVRRGDLDGIELDFGLNEYEQQAKAVTANVTLWPRPVTLVINRKTFESLTPRQQDALRQAGSAVLSDGARRPGEGQRRGWRHPLPAGPSVRACQQPGPGRPPPRRPAGLRQARGQRRDQVVPPADPGDEARDPRRLDPRQPALLTVERDHEHGRPEGDRARRRLPDQLHP